MPSIDLQDIRIARLERQLARWQRLVRWAVAAAGVTVLAGGIRVALAAPNCMQTLPAPLVTLCAGAPALAADVNGNFNALATNLINKVGPLGSADATIKGLARVGYHVISCANATNCPCPAGEVALSGGAECPNNTRVNASYPDSRFGPSTWITVCDNMTPTKAYAVCARIAQ